MKITESKKAKKIYKIFQSKIDPSAYEEEDLLLKITKYESEGQIPRVKVKVKPKKCTPKD